MAELTSKKRNALKKRDFAYVDKEGGEHLPISDKSHVRNAMARWNQTDFENAAAKEAARKKILKAARAFDIGVDPNDKIADGRD